MRCLGSPSLQVLVSLALAAACSRVAPDPNATDGGTGNEADEDGTECAPEPEEDQNLQLTVNTTVDILFVIDNSASMGAHQAKLAQSLDPLFGALHQAAVDYRVAFTTTDNGNPWCPEGQTTPEAGQFVLSSCKSRSNDFIWNNGEIDARDLACNDVCSLSSSDVETLPTTTDLDPTPAPRPWLESTGGVSNLLPNIWLPDAARCLAPQGINGCGFESQLESMYLSLLRTQTPDEASYGFLRPDAALAVVFVTDEADCSSNPDWATIFDANGDRLFWSDPASPFPTSALCWNAGVSCSGDPSAYDDCVAEDYDVGAQPGASEINAVLHPMSRFEGLLEGLELEKQQLNPAQDIIVMTLGGVQGNGADAAVSYSATGDPEHLLSFGIDPGCTGADGLSAVPPVRLRELSEAFTPGGLHSICAPDYMEAMAELGRRIDEELLPACYSSCAADSDPATPRLDPSCTLELDTYVVEPRDVSECLREGGEYVLDPETGMAAIPADDDLCFVTLVEEQDMSAQCVEFGSNVEFEIVRRPGWREPSGSVYRPLCLLDTCDGACPGL